MRGSKVHGLQLWLVMTSGLSRLANRFPDLAIEEVAQLIGATLEGVRWYPDVIGDLRLLRTPARVAGDACNCLVVSSRR